MITLNCQEVNWPCLDVVTWHGPISVFILFGEQIRSQKKLNLKISQQILRISA
jgi:hypothetical protein